MIASTPEGFLDHSLERSKYRASETPQGFTYDVIAEAYQRVGAELGGPPGPVQEDFKNLHLRLEGGAVQGCGCSASGPENVCLLLPSVFSAASPIWSLAPSVSTWLCSTAASTPSWSRVRPRCGRSAVALGDPTHLPISVVSSCFRVSRRFRSLPLLLQVTYRWDLAAAASVMKGGRLLYT